MVGFGPSAGSHWDFQLASGENVNSRPLKESSNVQNWLISSGEEGGGFFPKSPDLSFSLNFEGSADSAYRFQSETIKSVLG